MLQLLGLVTTAIGFHETRKLFGHPDFFTQAANWLQSLPRSGSAKIVTGTGALMTEGGDIMSGVGHTGPPPGASPEDRLARLENLIPLLEQHLSALDRGLDQERAERSNDDKVEKSARMDADERMGKQLELTATGGLQLSGVGLQWLILGTALAGFSPDFAPFPQSSAEHFSFRHTSWDVAFEVLYTMAALGFSIFYSMKAIEIFTKDSPSDYSPSKLIHERWLNFFGAATGWLCLWFVVAKLRHNLFEGTQPAITWGYALLALIAFVGVTGYLPFTVVKLANSIGGLVEKIPGLLKESDEKR